MAEFNEQDHPRDKNGEFTQKGKDNYTRDVNERIEWAKDNNVELPLNSDGSINDIELQRLRKMSAAELSKMLRRELPQKKMTPEEKIASVHIDFDRDNILPELNDDTLESIGLYNNKKVLFKKGAIERNQSRHSDLTDGDVNNIVAEALYNSVETFAAHSTKPYFHLAAFVESEISKKLKIGVVLLDVEKTKRYFEIGHVHFVRGDTYESVKKKTK